MGEDAGLAYGVEGHAGEHVADAAGAHDIEKLVSPSGRPAASWFRWKAKVHNRPRQPGMRDQLRTGYYP